MFLNILLHSDLWLHLLSGLALAGAVYYIERHRLKDLGKFKNILAQILLSNLIDLDHLLATPIFSPDRCSINNHALHSWWAFPAYAIGLLSRYRYFFLGVFLHLAIDALGCLI